MNRARQCAGRPLPLLQLPQRVELRHVARAVDPGADHRRPRGRGPPRSGRRPAPPPSRRRRRRRRRPGRSSPSRCRPARRRTARHPLDLLLDADQPDLLIVEHHDDDRQLLADGRVQLGDGHQEAAVAGEADDRPIRVGQPRRHAAWDRVAHRRQAVRGQELARAVRLPLLDDQQAARAGVARWRWCRAAAPSRAISTSRCGASPVRGTSSASFELLTVLAGGRLAPARARRRELGQARPAAASRSPTSSGSAGTSASMLWTLLQRQHRRRVRPRLRLQLDGVQPDRHDQVGLTRPSRARSARRSGARPAADDPPG